MFTVCASLFDFVLQKLLAVEREDLEEEWGLELAKGLVNAANVEGEDEEFRQMDEWIERLERLALDSPDHTQIQELALLGSATGILEYTSGLQTTFGTSEASWD